MLPVRPCSRSDFDRSFADTYFFKEDSELAHLAVCLGDLSKIELYGDALSNELSMLAFSLRQIERNDQGSIDVLDGNYSVNILISG